MRSFEVEAANTLGLRPEIARGLEILASAQGISVEDYLQHLAARELPSVIAEPAPSDESGMVWEDACSSTGWHSPSRRFP